MKVLLVGANGQIGKQLLKMFKENDQHTVRPMVRKEEQAAELKKEGMEAVLANLEGSVEELTEAAMGCDAVIFTAGSGGHTGLDKTLLIDLDGAVKMVEAAEKAGVERFVMVSALGADKRDKWNETIRPYYAAKHYADRMLAASSLNYTIVRPGGLRNEQGTGKVSTGAELERTSIPREDVARTVYAALDEENTYRKSFDIVTGDTPVAEAIKRI